MTSGKVSAMQVTRKRRDSLGCLINKTAEMEHPSVLHA